jgi:hypothetical protein
MKSMFDTWHGGRISSRQEMLNKIRTVPTNGSVIQEALHACSDEVLEQERRDRKFKLVRSEKSAPYVGERY